MRSFFAEPVVRLFLRALLAASVAFAAKFVVFDPTGLHVAYQSAALSAALVGAALAFAEVFTPLNNILGVLKLSAPAPKAIAPAKAPTAAKATVKP